MTVGDLLTKIIENCPSRGLDETVYIQEVLSDEISVNDYDIVSISDQGSNDALFITIKPWTGE